MSRVGREKSEASIKELTDLKGKIQHIQYELQIPVDKYLLTGLMGWINRL